LFFQPERFVLVVLGFMLAGYVYGCYGLLVGSILKRELEGVLLIVLVANIDAGWLQNPIYYADAQNKMIIRRLPAYFPSQVSMTAAFTDHSILNPLIGSVVYGSILLLGALLIYFWRMRIYR
jgi:ABC-2 type transport system permease protein